MCSCALPAQPFNATAGILLTSPSITQTHHTQASTDWAGLNQLHRPQPIAQQACRCCPHCTCTAPTHARTHTHIHTHTSRTPRRHTVLLCTAPAAVTCAILHPCANRNDCALRLPCVQAQFGLGLKEAASNLGICATTLKRACRRHGVRRWPRRQIAKLNKALTQVTSGRGWPLGCGGSAI